MARFFLIVLNFTFFLLIKLKKSSYYLLHQNFKYEISEENFHSPLTGSNVYLPIYCNQHLRVSDLDQGLVYLEFWICFNSLLY